MELMELATTLVRMCNDGEAEAFAETHYAPDIVSIEGEGSDEMPARLEGMDAVRRKGEWWFANNDVHSFTAEGPYVGFAPDQFAVRFLVDVTPKGGERMTMDELGLYRVKDGRIAEECFLYRTG
ncbi:MAG TPA: nuclear transport factor 2 family protein [Pseudomonadales bacterium]|nr:nuclear transport factor 2 family protein [Pseudomonadales bacterium]